MLKIRKLSKTYANGVHALKNINLDIPNGMFGLLGPNGAGKSSLMRTIATLQEPDSGSITLNGMDLLADPTAARCVLGYLPQDFGVYPKVSSETLLDHFAVLKGLTARGERRDVVESLLRQVNLWEVRKQALGGFSGGMRQRFGIAQALLGDPKLVIVDEPTAGLDPEERNRFLNLLAAIGQDVVVILSTHIVDDVTDLCPRMAIVCKGEVLLSGEPRAAIATLRQQVWRKTLRAEELADCQRRFTILSTRLVGGAPVIHVLCADCPDAGFEQVDADLEDVYFSHLQAHQARAA
ncbi:MAG: ABC transporter ATP-binding protein [Pseudomonadota bacterium]